MIQTHTVPLLGQRPAEVSPPRTGELLLPDGGRMSFMELGVGPRTLVFLPGAGDGLASVGKAAHTVAPWLRNKARFFRVIYLSRRESDTRVSLSSHAADVIWAMEALQLGPALIEAQSAGGPIGQLVAALRPDRVAALALSSSTAWLDPHARALCDRWLDHVRASRWDLFFEETADIIWRSGHRTLLRAFQHAIQRRALPEPGRIESILTNLLDVDHRALLPTIQVPTLVIGGADDRIFTADAQRLMAASIHDAKLILTPGHGHGHDLENPRHDETIAAFARLHSRRFIPDLR
jgi:pimeloyl-ACP methyl ester carboxylesterase